MKVICLVAGIVLTNFPLPVTLLCCHSCLWEEMKAKGQSDTEVKDTQIIRGCSLDCMGNIVKDGSCAPNGPQVH